MDDPEKRAKRAAYLREWRKRNPGYGRGRTAAWRAANPERARELREREHEKRKAKIETDRVEARAKGIRPKTLPRSEFGGENHVQWKGDAVSYSGLHAWIRRAKGGPAKSCDFCGTTDAASYDWANVDHKYARNPADWIPLCRKCHWDFDRRSNPKDSSYDWRAKT